MAMREPWDEAESANLRLVEREEHFSRRNARLSIQSLAGIDRVYLNILPSATRTLFVVTKLLGLKKRLVKGIFLMAFCCYGLEVDSINYGI